MKRRKKLNNRQIIFLIIVVCCVAAAVGMLIYREYVRRSSMVSSGGNYKEIEPTGTVTYAGEKYRYNEDLKTILFLGVDKREEVQVQEYAGWSGQSDCMFLLVMNKKEKTTELLQISRDSMVNLKIYDMSGEFLAEQRGQIALQYAYGDGEKKSCRLAREAVSELLYGIPIDACISLNLDGIASVTDALGGVEVTCSGDAKEIDPAYMAGSKVRMNGSQAEQYVRYRDVNVSGSNNLRMERQTGFLQDLFSQVKAMAAGNQDVFDRLIESASPYMVSDMTGEEMKSLSEYRLSEEYEKVPGTVRAGGEHDEFIVDEDNLRKTVIKMFYKRI